MIRTLMNKTRCRKF